MFNLLKTINRIVSLTLHRLLAMILLLLTAFLCVNVVLRYFFGGGAFYSVELSIYLMIWMVFLGAVICVHERCHLNVEIVYKYLKNPFLVRALYVSSTLLSLFIIILISVLGLEQAIFVFKSGQITPAMRIPMGIPYLIFPISGALMVLQYIEQLFEDHDEVLSLYEDNDSNNELG